jgi:hypothetical protein
MGRLQKQRPQPEKSLLSSRPGEDVVGSWESKHDIRTVPRPKLFASWGDYRNKGHNLKNLS